MSRKLKIVIATHGTVGSLEPLFGLSKALRARGHAPVFAAPEPLASRARAIDETISLVTPSAERQLGFMVAKEDQPLAYLQAQLPATPAYFHQLRQLVERADVLVGFPFFLATTMVRDAVRTPFVSLHFNPFFELTSKNVQKAMEALINPVRLELGLPTVTDPLGVDSVSKELALFLVSPSVFQAPKRWTANRKIVGYLFHDDPTPPSDELKKFVESGEPPVVVSLGSVIHADPDRITATLIEALTTAGVRAVLQRGWSGLGHITAPSSVFVAEFVPHSWLVPRASVVVHAGGAGTMAATLRAGLPAVVVPHVNDQPLWAALVQSKRCGVVVPFQKLTASALADGLRATIDQPSYREHARALASRLALEQAAETACDLIESVARP